MKKMLTGWAALWSLAVTGQDSTTHSTTQSHPLLSFSGFVEAYYSYDFNQPEDNRRPHFLYSHNRHHEFNVNLAYVKGSYATDRVRAALALAVGTYMNANYAAEPGALRNIYEAHAGYKLLRAGNLWLDVGVLPSHIGFESAHSPSCWTLTRSLAAENSPYYEAGARLTYTSTSGLWLFSALALNGWQRIQRVEGNSLVSWGTQVQYNPDEKLSINYSTFLGTDYPDSTRKWRYFHDLYTIWQVSDKAGLILGIDLGWEQQTINSSLKSFWFTPVGILRITPSPKWSLALRGEYYRDEEGVLIHTGTPNGFQTFGVSAGLDYWPQKNAAIRLEGRALHSKDAIFNKGSNTKENNTALTLSLSLTL